MSQHRAIKNSSDNPFDEIQLALRQSAQFLQQNQPNEALALLLPIYEQHSELMAKFSDDAGGDAGGDAGDDAPNDDVPGTSTGPSAGFPSGYTINPDLAINLSGAYIMLYRWDDAIPILEEAAASHLTNSMLWSNLAAAYLHDLDESKPSHQNKAIAAYLQVLKIDPKAPNVHYNLGLIYNKRRDFNRAIAFFLRAIDINPTDRDARRMIEVLDPDFYKSLEALEA